MRKVAVIVPECRGRVKFLPFLTHFGHFRGLSDRKKKMNKTKKLHLVLGDVGKLFYFMTFIPRLNILDTQGET